MQKQIQERKIITFEELCPQWAEAIRKGKISGQLGAATNCCIVGEAHGFSDKYASISGPCPECWNLSTRLVNSSRFSAIYLDTHINNKGYVFYGPEMNIRHEQLEIEKEAFLKHWNECHVRGSD